MRKTLLVPMAATILMAGCSMDINLGGGSWGGFGGLGPCCAPGIVMSPSTTNLLIGDTIRLSTLFFPPGSDSTTWSVGDSAFRVVRLSSAPSDTLVLQAARRGSALIIASRAGTAASLLLNAHDSSDVTAVRVSFPSPDMTIPLATRELTAAGQVMIGNMVLGSQTPRWSTTDTSKAAIVTVPVNLFRPEMRTAIVLRGTGQVYIIAAWGALRDSVRVTITP